MNEYAELRRNVRELLEESRRRPYLATGSNVTGSSVTADSFDAYRRPVAPPPDIKTFSSPPTTTHDAAASPGVTSALGSLTDKVHAIELQRDRAEERALLLEEELLDRHRSRGRGGGGAAAAAAPNDNNKNSGAQIDSEAYAQLQTSLALAEARSRRLEHELEDVRTQIIGSSSLDDLLARERALAERSRARTQLRTSTSGALGSSSSFVADGSDNKSNNKRLAAFVQAEEEQEKNNIPHSQQLTSAARATHEEFAPGNTSIDDLRAEVSAMRAQMEAQLARKERQLAQLARDKFDTETARGAAVSFAQSSSTAAAAAAAAAAVTATRSETAEEREEENVNSGSYKARVAAATAATKGRGEKKTLPHYMQATEASATRAARNAERLKARTAGLKFNDIPFVVGTVSAVLWSLSLSLSLSLDLLSSWFLMHCHYSPFD